MSQKLHTGKHFLTVIWLRDLVITGSNATCFVRIELIQERT
jgi:hypothetical protein